MAAPTKQSSRWGSFLQQAVAGVESRLDNILTEGAEDGGKSSRPANLTPDGGGRQSCLYP
jgi:TATA element modulatory factor